jgi:hypothetical protein
VPASAMSPATVMTPGSPEGVIDREVATTP